MMKHIHVSCAIIERDGNGLSTQRSETRRMPGRWELPGGKIKQGERAEECLKREVREELDLEVSVGRPLKTVTHQYPTFVVTLYPYICKITSGSMKLHEHKAFKWLLPEKLHELDWAAADVPLIEDYRRSIGFQ